MSTKPGGISLTPEYARALNDYELLRESLLKTEEEKEYLLHQTFPYLQSLYLSKVGKLKLELLQTRLEVYRLKRKMELIQSCINRQSEVVLEAIEILIDKEIEEQKKILEEESKKLEGAMLFISIPSLSSDESRELKTLYYKLARMLHPDLNPEQDETMRMMWLKVSEAYQQADLNQLKLIEVLMHNASDESNVPTKLEELMRRNNLFSSRITQLMKEIEIIKSNFPFTYSDLLENEAWVVEENNISLNAISKTNEEKLQYETAINVLLSGLE